jgi:hypothetical protein
MESKKNKQAKKTSAWFCKKSINESSLPMSPQNCGGKNGLIAVLALFHGAKTAEFFKGGWQGINDGINATSCPSPTPGVTSCGSENMQGEQIISGWLSYLTRREICLNRSVPDS